MIFLILLISLVSAITITSVRSTPEQVAPGETIRITLGIENELGSDASNIAVNLDLSAVPFAPYQSSTEKSIDELDDGDDDTVLFNLVALSDATAGVYKIPVKITYDVDEQTLTKTSFISITINARPILVVESSNSLIKGRNNDITIEVTNTGLTEAKFLTIIIKETSGVRIIGTDNIYLGNIESDDFDSADFKILVSVSANSNINLPVELTYRDATNKLQTDNFNLNLKAYDKEQAIEIGLIQKNNTLLYVTITIAVIALWLIYRMIRKRRRKKNREA